MAMADCFVDLGLMLDALLLQLVRANAFQ